MVNRKISAILIVLMLSNIAMILTQFDTSEADSDDTFPLLLDYGNGQTQWMIQSGNGTLSEIIESTLVAQGHTVTIYGASITVDSIIDKTVGGSDTGGSFTASGTTGNTIDVSWQVFIWEDSSKTWKTADDLSVSSPGPIAVAYYPNGIMPVETPMHRSSWTMVEKDSYNSANQNAEISTDDAELVFEKFPTRDKDGVYSAVLYANGFAFIKYGDSTKTIDKIVDNHSYIECYDTSDWTLKWTFKYPTTMLETTTCLVVGNYLYVQSMEGHIYKINYKIGPGFENSYVKSFNGEPWDTPTAIPNSTGHEVIGSAYGYGASSFVFYGGAIYTKCSNGMIYAFDTDLNLIWAYQTEGMNYFSTPTVTDEMVFAGTYDGCLYVLDCNTGAFVSKESITHKTDKDPGCVNTPAVMKNGTKYTVFVTYSEGGTFSTYNGYAVYEFDGTNFTKILNETRTGGVSTYLTHYKLAEKNSVILAMSDSIKILDADGSLTLISTFFSGDYTTHSAPTFVNNTTLFIGTYQKGTEGRDSAQAIYSMDLTGKITGKYPAPTLQYSMSPIVVVDGLILTGNDAGVYAVHGTLGEYVPPVDNSIPLWMILLVIVIVIIIALAIMWTILRYALKWEHPFEDLRTHVMTYFFGENYTHNTKSKRKLRVVVILGSGITFIMALASLCIGSETTIGINEAISATISSIQKGGHHLDKIEMLIYNQRLPRAIATICVGIGLSVAGAVYQAVIKNPLVEPYIMGVSSGAGTFAIATIIYGFTFMGLFSANSPYLIAFSAIVGGLVAFGLTMILAIKTGGNSVNFVLSGIIIGLVFSAAQSIMMIGTGSKASNALAWLYGSFINVGWETIWLIVFPCLGLSLIPLIWAKELNLVLIGEDQAMQMGLNAKKFDMYMLIIISVLTAFCVAFCGIIGFVGLVIPHLSRMILGGDHRLMLPTSMAFGGCLLLTADLLSRILITGYELPVGAITTIIGVPVFAYLLIRRGRSYDG